VTLLKLCEIYVFDQDPAILPALQRGFAWEGTRILPTGQINTTGNSRVGAGDTYFGALKEVKYPEAIRAFALFGAFTGDKSYTQSANQLCQYYSAHPNQ
jgi:hypothetical protein